MSKPTQRLKLKPNSLSRGLIKTKRAKSTVPKGYVNLNTKAKLEANLKKYPPKGTPIDVWYPIVAMVVLSLVAGLITVTVEWVLK